MKITRLQSALQHDPSAVIPRALLFNGVRAGDDRDRRWSLSPDVCFVALLQVEADIAPFRALLLGMFFMTVGFEIDVLLCLNNLPLVAGLVSSRAAPREHLRRCRASMEYAEWLK